MYQKTVYKNNIFLLTHLCEIFIILIYKEINIFREIQNLVQGYRSDYPIRRVSHISQRLRRWLCVAAGRDTVARDTAGKGYMGRKDLVGKDFFADCERFAELMNTIVYCGEEVVKAENLIRMDRVYPSPLRNGEKTRDILMKEIGQNICYGLELETEADYSMPERVMVYDTCEWETQIREIGKQRVSKKMNYRDKKSRLRETDSLMPVITVVLYLGNGRWQGKRSLSELFSISPQSRKRLGDILPDYRFLLAEADYVDADGYETDLKEFFHALQCRKDKLKLAELLQTESFQNIKKETAWVIAVYLDREKLMTKMKEKGIDMCQALDELLEDKRREGRIEGERAGKREGKREGRRTERILIIRRMIQEGMDRSLVSRITECTNEEMELAVNSND